ncbi:MAG: YcxB family protein [Oscillospiraceae bacterium]
MKNFYVESKGLERREFVQAVHRFSFRFLAEIVLIIAAISVVLGFILGPDRIGYLWITVSIIPAVLLFFEMKTRGNYGKFDYKNVVFQFNFSPESWEVIRNYDKNDRNTFAWKDTEKLMETRATFLLVPSVKNISSFTLPKRSLTPEQMAQLREWFKDSKKK